MQGVVPPCFTAGTRKSPGSIQTHARASVHDNPFRNQRKAMSKLIDEPLIYVTTSNIHGKGLFARKRIKAGTLIGQIEARPTDTDGPYVLWLTQRKAVEVQCQLKYINHSDEPNAIYYDTLEVIALRDIQRDEEITHNYDSV